MRRARASWLRALQMGPILATREQLPGSLVVDGVEEAAPVFHSGYHPLESFAACACTTRGRLSKGTG